MRYERTEHIVVSADADAKKAGEGKSVKVTFVFDNFTEVELIDRLMISSSPKVAVAGVLRKKNPIPSTYTYNVPKAGTRSVESPEDMIARMTPEQKLDFIAKLQAEIDAQLTK